MGAMKYWRSSSKVIAAANWNEQWIKMDQWTKKSRCTLHLSIASWLREHFKLDSIAAAHSLAVDPSFSDHIWSLEAMTIDKRVLLPSYEISAKEIEDYIK